MPEEITGSKPLNPEIKPDQQTLRDHQDVYEPSDLSEMDKAAAELIKKSAEEDEVSPADKPTDQTTPPADKPADQTTPPADKPADQTPPPADKPVDQTPSPADPYPDVQLPPNVRGKSAEAWAEVKTRFARDLSDRDQKISTLESKVKELEASRGESLTKELREELESLREFKTRLDIEADPSFSAKYDSKISQLREFIYSQLKGSGKVSEGLLKKMQELGGPDEVANIDKVFEAVDNPQVQRIVQAKLDEIEVLKFDKAQDLDKAKKNVRQYIEQRSQEYAQSVNGHRKETQTRLDAIVPKFEWLKEPPPLAAGAKDSEKKAREELVAHQTEIKGYLDLAVKDDSAEMRATLIAGVAQLLNLKREHSILKASYEAAQKELKEANDKLDKIKQASVSRLRGSSAPPSDKLPSSVKLNDPNLNAGLALDDLRRLQLASAR